MAEDRVDSEIFELRFSGIQTSRNILLAMYVYECVCVCVYCVVLECAVLCCVEILMTLSQWEFCGYVIETCFIDGFASKELGNRHPPLEYSVVIVMMENSVHAEFIHVLDGILMTRVDGLVLHQLSISIEWRRLLLLV